MVETPAEWALSRAIDLIQDQHGCGVPGVSSCATAFARYIAQHETPPVDPVDPLIREAREIWAKWYDDLHFCTSYSISIRNGEEDESDFMKLAVSLLKRGIELGTAGDDNDF